MVLDQFRKDLPKVTTLCTNQTMLVTIMGTPLLKQCRFIDFWAGAPSCYLELLNKLQKQTCRAVGHSLAASLEPLAHGRNVASLKVVSTKFLLVCFVCLKESTCETRKYAFYFTSKALLVLKIINF